MVKVIFIERCGNRKECDASAGISMLELAHANDVDIEGVCGGSLACATCHLHIGEGWLGKLGVVSEEELDMMELAHDRRENSRLGCQIEVTEELEGLTVSLPKKEF